MDVTRRFLLKVSAASAACVSIGIMSGHVAATEPDAFDPSFFIDLLPSGKVRVKITRSELGQGAQTGLAQIVAEEVGALWSDMDIVIWPYSQESDHLPEDYDGAGGSMSVRLLWKPLRTGAAALREMLQAAAAHKWNVPLEECEVADSAVRHKPSGRNLAFADLFDVVKGQALPANPKLKKTHEFKIVGQSVASVDNEAIVTGGRGFSIDDQIEGMQFAVIERPPVRGAVLKDVDDSEARKIPGVVDIVKIDPIPQTGHPIDDWETNYRSIVGGIAVIATSSWAAIKGRAALKTLWDEGGNAGRSSETLKHELRAATQQKGETVRNVGDTTQAFEEASKVYDFTYDNPFQAPCPLEPLNAVAHVEGDACTIWAGSQSQSFTARYIADVLGLSREKMVVHVRPSGGGFGRRYFYDFMTEAAVLSQKTGRPIKLFWTREDDIRHTRAHPARAERLRIALDANERPLAFESIAGAADGDPYGVYGLFNPYSYGCAHIRDAYVFGPEKLLDVGSWRSVSAHWQSFTRECVIDEIAVDLGRDPVEMRLDWLNMPIRSTNDAAVAKRIEGGRRRAKYVLMRAAELADWEGKRARGEAIGIALDRYGNTWVSEVVELDMTGTEPIIKKITCVFDCGLVVNPQLVRAQIEGSLVWALQPIMSEPLKVENGRVVQSNFDDYELPRMSDMPEMQVEIVDSTMTPSGAGEPAVPSLGPATLNAYFAATGIRKRSLPLVS